MKLLFRQRFFSWYDSYDIYGENGEVVYVVKGELAWGRCLKIFDVSGNELGMIKQKVFSWFPTFWWHLQGSKVGKLSRVYSFPNPKYRVDFKGWDIIGNILGMEYQILTKNKEEIAHISKQIFKLTDTYVIDVKNPQDALCALMSVVSIDVEKCLRKN